MTYGNDGSDCEGIKFAGVESNLTVYYGGCTFRVDKNISRWRLLVMTYVSSLVVVAEKQRDI